MLDVFGWKLREAMEFMAGCVKRVAVGRMTRDARRAENARRGT
jgi:hypothetical protein